MKKAIVLLLVFGAGVGVAVLATSGGRETYTPTSQYGNDLRQRIHEAAERQRQQTAAEDAAFRGAVRAAAYDRAINH